MLNTCKFAEQSLREIINTKKISVEFFLKTALSIVNTLIELQQKGINNYALYPENIIITKDENNITAKLINRSGKSKPVQYMSPEETGILNVKCDFRKDFYTLGVIYYEMVTGTLLIKGEDILETIYDHFTSEFQEPVGKTREFHKIIWDIIKKLVNKNPANRYLTYMGLKSDLERCLYHNTHMGFINSFELGQKDIASNLIIPKKYFGRKFLKEKLSDLYNNTGNGKNYFLMLKGESGTGKSSVVKEIQKNLYSKNDYCISINMKKNREPISYFHIMEQFTTLINRILMENESTIASWRYRLLNGLGSNVKVVSEYIPGLKLVLGNDYEVENINDYRVFLSFKDICKKLIKIFTENNHIFMIAVDNAQWIDDETLQFINSLLIGSNIKNLLLVCTWTDSEEDSGEFHSFTEQFNHCGVKIETVVMEPLAQEEISAILLDCYSYQINKLEELTAIVKIKTQGNLYFINKFIKDINQRCFMEYNYEKGSWDWNAEQVGMLPGKEKLVNLISRRIKDMPLEVIEFLKIACCFKDSFLIQTISEICHSTTSEIMDIALVCIREELIIELEPGEFVIADRKITDAVNNILTLEEKQNINFKIARAIADEYSHNTSKVKIFDLLYYFNICRDRINGEKEILSLVKLYYEGGLKAAGTYAYNEAAGYFDIALGYMDSNFRNKHHQLAWDIYVNAINCYYSIAEFNKADYYSELLLCISRTTIEKCRIYNIMIKQYTRWNKIQSAINLSYRAINMMESGSMAKYYLNKKKIREEFRKLVKSLRGKDPMMLLQQEKNANADKCLLMEIYSSLWLLGYLSCKENLCMVSAVRMYKISSYYGNMSASAFGYACFGGELIDKGELELGSSFGKLALELNRIYDNVELDCRVKLVFGLKICFHQYGLKKSADYLKEAYNAAVKCGDFIYAANAAISLLYIRYIFGEKLENVKSAFDKARYAPQHKDFKTQSNLHMLSQDISNLMGAASDHAVGSFEDNGVKIRIKFLYYTFKAMQCYIMEEYQLALQYLDKVNCYLNIRDNNPLKMVCYYIYALTAAALFNSTGDSKFRNILTDMNEKLKAYKPAFGENGMCLLAEAEYCRVTGRDVKAMQLYEKALQQADIDEDRNLAALCSELAFKYYLSQSINKTASMHYNNCIKHYEYWGYKIKAEKLKSSYQGIFKWQKAKNFNIDLNAMFKSAQIITNEIDYNQLIKKLIRLMMERAGAERCCFITENDNRLYVIADTFSNNLDIELFSAKIPLENYMNVLKTVIYYVSRIKEPVAIDDAIKSQFYFGEKYVTDNNVKSVLCIPICCGSKIKAILYLENNLIRAAFSKNTIEILKLLTSQAATAMENASMYNSIKEMNEELENLVRERTDELETALNLLKQEDRERKAVEEALQESESRLRTLINNTTDCITFKDGQGRYVEINEAALKLLGLEGIDYRNKTNNELYCLVDKNKETFKRIEEMDKITLIAGREMRFNEKLINGRGEENYFDIVKNPVFNSQGENKALVVVARNITDKEKTEELRQRYRESTRKLEEVMEYDRMKTEFIANISHELRTPLNVILSSHQMCELVLKNQIKSDISSRFNKYMGMTKQNCYRLLRLINNLIDITKIDSGYLTPEFIKGDIVNFIEGITMSVVTFAESKGISVIFDTEVEEKYICFDKDKIERIMLNLLSNAIKFTPAKGYIYVNLNDFYDKISISVKDTGIGIPEEKKSEIFKRFVQLDKSFTRENEGSGIGLSLVKSLVDMHKGEITVRSEPGKGSEFIVTLPVMAAENINIKEESISETHEDKIERVKIEFSDIYV